MVSNFRAAVDGPEVGPEEAVELTPGQKAARTRAMNKAAKEAAAIEAATNE